MAKKLAGNSRKQPAAAKKGRGSGRPFVKNDPRINRSGVPAEAVEVKKALMCHGQELVTRLMTAVRKGNVVAIKTGLEYVLGKPPQAVEMSGPGGKPIEVSDAREKLAARIAALAARAATPDGDSEPKPAGS